jgi:hypothetical protein
MSEQVQLALIGAGVSIVGTVCSSAVALLAYLKAKEGLAKGVENAGDIGEVHKVVNSRYDALLSEIAQMRNKEEDRLKAEIKASAPKTGDQPN